MKPTNTSKPLFSAEQRAAALAAAPAVAVADGDNPVTAEPDWSGAIKTHGGGVAATLTELRRARGQRGAQKAPKKVATAIRLSPEVVAFFKAGGPGWQTRVDAALAEWIKTHTPEQA